MFSLTDTLTEMSPASPNPGSELTMLSPRARQIIMAAAGDRAALESLMTDRERSLFSAAIGAGLPRQASFICQDVCRRLCTVFADETHYTLLGKRTEGPERIGMHGNLITVDMAQGSRSIPAGPCVFSCRDIEEYEQRLPEPVIFALAEVRSPVELFTGITCLEPVLKRRMRDGSVVYCRSLSQVRSMYRTIDPLVVGSLRGAPDMLFLLAHWD